MREIRYRGIGIAERKWVFGSLWFDTRDGVTLIWSEELKYWVRVDPATVGQYTGLKDKNGKEIYEDDILLDESGAYAVVYYSMGSFCVDFGEGFDLQYFTDRIHEICYVVGNIHDNSELLKGGEQ